VFRDQPRQERTSDSTRKQRRPALRTRQSCGGGGARENASSTHAEEAVKADENDEHTFDQFFSAPLGAPSVSDSLAELFGVSTLDASTAPTIDTFLAMNSDQMTTPMRVRSAAASSLAVPACVIQLGAASHWQELEVRAVEGLRGHPQVYDEIVGKEPRLSSLKAAAKARRISSITSTMNLTDHLHLSGGKSLMVYGKIGDERLPGTGGTSTFYMVDPVDACDRTVGPDEQCKRIALRMDTPRTAWEFYVNQQLLERLPEEERLVRHRLGKLHSLHLYQSRSFLILDHSSHGTLENMLNVFKTKKRSARSPLLPEVLAVFYTIEMLRIVNATHSVGIIHGELVLVSVSECARARD
jgi:hypothetical protein